MVFLIWGVPCCLGIAHLFTKTNEGIKMYICVLLLYSSAQILVLVFMQKPWVFLDGLLVMPLCLSYFLGNKHMPMIITQELFDKLAIAVFWCIGTVLLIRSFSN